MMAHESPIRRQAGQQASPDTLMVGSATEMLSIIDRTARGMIPDDCPPVEELLREIVVDEKNPKRTRANFFLVARSWRSSVKGVVQKVGVINFGHACRLAIQAQIDRLEKVWSGKWAVVAVVREVGSRTRGERVTKEDPARAMAMRGAGAAAFSSAESAAAWKDRTPDITQVHRLAVVEEQDIIVHFVLAELNQREIHDPLSAAVSGHKEGAWHTYGNTGLIRDMPVTWKKSRDTAKALIEEFHGAEAAAGRRALSAEERAQVVGMLGFTGPDRVAAALRMPLDLVLRIQAEAAKDGERAATEKQPPKKGRAPKSGHEAPQPSDTLE